MRKNLAALFIENPPVVILNWTQQELQTYNASDIERGLHSVE
jgi:hypothetical protein